MTLIAVSLNCWHHASLLCRRYDNVGYLGPGLLNYSTSVRNLCMQNAKALALSTFDDNCVNDPPNLIRGPRGWIMRNFREIMSTQRNMSCMDDHVTCVKVSPNWYFPLLVDIFCHMLHAHTTGSEKCDMMWHYLLTLLLTSLWGPVPVFHLMSNF